MADYNKFSQLELLERVRRSRTLDEDTITGVDLGTRENTTSDLTVLFTICVHPHESREVLWIESGRWTAPAITTTPSWNTTVGST